MWPPWKPVSHAAPSLLLWVGYGYNLFLLGNEFPSCFINICGTACPVIEKNHKSLNSMEGSLWDACGCICQNKKFISELWQNIPGCPCWLLTIPWRCWHSRQCSLMEKTSSMSHSRMTSTFLPLAATKRQTLAWWYMCLTLAADHSHHKIHIRTVDTDLVVLAVIVAQTLPDGDELWVANLPCTGLCSCDGDCI